MLEDRNDAGARRFRPRPSRSIRGLPHALANRGYLLNRLGRFDEAFADLARALELAPRRR